MTREQLLRQIELAHKEMQNLAKLYPGAFDKQGKPIVASALLPALPTTPTKDTDHERQLR